MKPLRDPAEMPAAVARIFDDLQSQYLLLIGNKGGRGELLANYARINQAPLVAHSEVVAFVRDRKLNGRGIGWIDAHLLASALVGRLKLWTADLPLATVARQLGIGYG